MKLKLLALVASPVALLASAAAHADTSAVDTVTTAAVGQITAIQGISGQFAVPLFGLAVVGVGIAIGMKYIKKGKGAA